MRYPRGWLISLILGLVLGVAGSAWATLDNTKSFKQAYPDAKVTGCKTCHGSAVGKKGDLNAYGLALQKAKAAVAAVSGDGATARGPAADAKKLTAEDYKTVEAQDADGDGVSNTDEIRAGTNPGVSDKS